MTYVAKGFAVLKVRRKNWGSMTANGQYEVQAVALSRVVQKRTSVSPDETLVEIELVFPEGFFDQPEPKAVIRFPDPPPPQQVRGKAEVAEPLELELEPVFDQDHG